MNVPLIMTEGQGGGSVSKLYSFDCFLMITISAPSSFSALRAASRIAAHRFPMGSFIYSVMTGFPIYYRLLSPG